MANWQTKIKSAIARLFSKKEIWQLRGYDTFSQHSYPLAGRFFSEAAAERAAQKRLNQLNQTQPPNQSGGQDGIQDQVYVVRPDGGSYRYRGE